MLVRLAEPGDTEAIVAMGRQGYAEAMPPDWFDEATWRDTIRRSFDEAQPTFFVAERSDGVLAGLVEAFILGYEYRTGLYVGQRILYVTPENRGTRAAVSLVKHLIAWARRAGAIEVVSGNSNSSDSERTARLFEHLGYRRKGCSFAVLLEEPNDVFQ
jgi:GNAT superfamily N-acetyltransferase